jgi:hypothetical protein
MERSKGIILVIAGLAAVLIVWKVAFKPVPEEKTPADPNKTTTSTQPGASAAASSRISIQEPDRAGEATTISQSAEETRIYRKPRSG